MMAWHEPPEADIDQHVNRISRKFGSTVRRIRELLAQLEIETLNRQEERRIIREINALLDALDAEIEVDAEEAYKDVYEHGRARVLVALGLFVSIGAAKRFLRSSKAKTSHTHRAFMREYEVMVDDLLAATQNTRRQVKRTIRQIAAERLRDGIRDKEGVYSIRRDIKADMRKRLGEAADFAIRDRANRRWKLHHYVDVVVRTKLAEAHRESTRIEAMERGALYVVVSQHGDACEKCKPWESRILKLDPSAPGSYPTLDEAMGAGLFHPSCAHSITPLRDPEFLTNRR